MGDLWNYDTSWLNPALKAVIALLYIFVAFVYFRSRANYTGGLLQRALNLLFWMAVVGCLAAATRYFGDGTQFGFTKQFSLKWFQSLGYVIQAVLFALAGRTLLKSILPNSARNVQDIMKDIQDAEKDLQDPGPAA